MMKTIKYNVFIKHNGQDMKLDEVVQTKEVKVDPSSTQLSNGAKALDELTWFNHALMQKFSAKEKRLLCAAVYKAMVGNPA